MVESLMMLDEDFYSSPLLWMYYCNSVVVVVAVGPFSGNLNRDLLRQ